MYQSQIGHIGLSQPWREIRTTLPQENKRVLACSPEHPMSKLGESKTNRAQQDDVRTANITAAKGLGQAPTIPSSSCLQVCTPPYGE